MSSTPGARGAFRGLSNADGQRQPRAGFQSRGRANVRGARGGYTRGTARAAGNAAVAVAPTATTGMAKAKTTAANMNGAPGGDSQQRFQLLKKRREDERKHAIRNGFLADPDKPRTLAEAITPVGTCPDKCAEFERLERIVQNDVWSQETRPDGTPDEARMVKKFRRAAAGIDEQLPSDLRPPTTLRKTCDYLFDDLIGSADSLGTVHHFVWDRTRAIRNDFSIQQITKPADVEIAIECYERIARFHILSLHQFAIPEKPYDKYDWYQEREQLDRTLLSLMQYYDDNRGRVDLENEPEFRAYSIIFQIQDPIPDLEERVSCYPANVKNHPRVKTALDLYAAACNVLDPQGPLKPRAAHPVAREDWNTFFSKVESTSVSYLMACVAEIYFDMVRRQTLNGIWRAFKRQGNPTPVTDFSLDYLTDIFRFDDPDQTHHFCEKYGFVFKELPDKSDDFLDLNSVAGKIFPEPVGGSGTQTFSQSVVENKRHGRSFPAVIRGYNVRKARSEGLINEEDVEFDEEMVMSEEQVINADDTSKDAPLTSSQSGGKSTSVFPSFGTTQSAFVNPFKAADTATPISETKPSPFFAPAQAAPGFNTGSNTPAGSPFTPKPGLQDSAFASKPSSSSPFPSWGKASTPTWGQPSTTGADSMLGQTTKAPAAAGSNTPTQSQPALTSIHAPPTWGKPAPSPWSTPVSNPAFGSAKFGASTNGTESISGQPSTGSTASTQPPSQQTLPTFSWSPPVLTKTQTKPSEAAKEVSFSSVFSPAEKTESKPPMFSFTQTSSAPPSKDAPSHSGPIFTRESAQAAAFTSSVLPPSKAATSATSQTPLFAPSSIASTSGGKSSQDDQNSGPMFSFSSKTSTPQPQPVDRQITSGSPFASTKDSSDRESKPIQSANAQPQPQHAQASSGPASTFNPPKGPSHSFSHPNQPKRRSPLSQSFSAEEDQSIASGSSSTINFDTPPKPAPKSSPAVTPIGPPPSSKSASHSHIKAPDFGSILQKLAGEIITDPDRGLLRQFVEYHARPIILSVHDQLYLEEMQEMADKFRQEKVAKKYGRRWRETAWRLRLARQGREKREKRRSVRRNRTAAEVAKKRRLEEDAVDEFLKRRSVHMQQSSVNGGSPAQNASQANRRDSISSTSTADLRMANRDADTGLGSEKPRNAPGTDAAERRDDFVKPATPAPSQEAVNRRSHFLGFSMSKQKAALGAATPTSRSTYFRMKAMGLNPNGTSIKATPTGPSPPNIKKRARDEDTDTPEDLPPQKRSKTPPASILNGHTRPRSVSFLSQSSVFQPSPVASVSGSFARSRVELDDEDLIARARAARQSLRQSTRSRHEPPSPMMASIDADTKAVESAPTVSLGRARLHAQLRAAARAESSLARAEDSSARSARSPDVPAYRLRESRFVPREHYGRALERARENMERRSRPASVVGVGEEAPTPATTQAMSTEVQASFTKADTPSNRRESSVTQQADASADDAAGNDINQNQFFGIGRFSQPPTPGIASQASFAFPTIESLSNAQASLHQSEDQPESMDLHSAEVAPSQPLVNSFQDSFASHHSNLGEEIDTHNVSTSAYLSIGDEFHDNLSAQSSMYPDLSHSFGHSTNPIDHGIQETQEPIHGEHDYLNSAAHQALEMDISTSSLVDGPYVDQSGPIHAKEYLSDGLLETNGQSQRQEIDPSLMFSAVVNHLEIPESIAELDEAEQESQVVPETQPDIHKMEVQPTRAKEVSSNNPFATLAEDTDGSHGSERSSSAEEGSEPSVTGSISPLREEIDEQPVTNGSIQDAQHEVIDAGTSFPSTTTRAPSVPLDDGPARHTRSRSRDLSHATRSGPSTLDAVNTALSASQPRYSLRSSPIAELPETEDQVEGDNEESGLDDSEPAAVSSKGKSPEASEIAESGSESDDEVASGSESDNEVGSGSEDGVEDNAVDSDQGDERSQDGDDDAESYVSEEQNSPEEAVDEDDGPGQGDVEEQYDGESEEGEDEQDGYDEDEEEFDSEEAYSEEEDEEMYTSGGSRGLTPGQMQQSGIVKGGTGTTAEDAFELSD
ncbi:hypothetical protein ANO11243_047110 [Dothideomycetidae sp. 11243]|nr:hypothetical protein ANO11243_047110 [fungal sp. No.11243]